MDGTKLYDLVEAYAALGDHRTGTACDAATIEWFAGQLRRQGATATVEPFAFARYDATWHVRVDGREVESLPIFYSGVGSTRTHRPATGRLSVTGARASSTALADLTAAATAGGHSAAVVTTEGPSGRLTALNRPIGPADGIPVLAVGPGHDLDGRALDVAIDAACVPGTSANVVARFAGATPAAPGLVVTTPLSGWFRCAGERGTGIAVLLDLVAPLADRGPLTVVGTSGHELEAEGLRHLLAGCATAAGAGADDADGRAAPDAVIHLGASIAARGGDGRLAPGAVRHAVPGAHDALAAALTPLGRRVDAVGPDQAGDPRSWIGEAGRWCALGVPLLSLAGGFPLFHTSADVPGAATSPELLAQAASAIRRAADVVVDATAAAGGGRA